MKLSSRNSRSLFFFLCGQLSSTIAVIISCCFMENKKYTQKRFLFQLYGSHEMWCFGFDVCVGRSADNAPVLVKKRMLLVTCGLEWGGKSVFVNGVPSSLSVQTRDYIPVCLRQTRHDLFLSLKLPNTDRQHSKNKNCQKLKRCVRICWNIIFLRFRCIFCYLRHHF